MSKLSVAFFNSFSKRISAIFIVLIILLAASQYAILQHLWNQAWLEQEQQFFWGIAQNYEAELHHLLKDEIDKDQVIQALFRLQRLNPRIDPFILDGEGTPLYFIPDSGGDYNIQKVSLAPIKKSLTFADFRNLPILGTNPRQCSSSQCSTTVFSVAPIHIGSTPGYLYIILNNAPYRNIANAVEDYYLLFGGAIISGVFTLAFGIFGIFLFSLLTRRFYRLTKAVQSYGNGDFSERVSEKGSDEIAQLAQNVNKMADTISAQIAQLRETDLLRRQLVANVSHDLNSPLTSLQGQLQLLQLHYSKLTESEKLEKLEVAHNGAQSLSKLIAELLELSNLEAKDIEPTRSEFLLQEVISEEIFPRLQDQARERNIFLRLECPEETPCVLADCDLIERALSNLVENALQYSGKASQVLVSIHAKGGAPANSIEISVADDGIGIAKNELCHIFDRYYRGNAERDSSTGSGLGLAIVKKIVEVHDANITVEGDLGQGLRFTFCLPTAVGYSQRGEEK